MDEVCGARDGLVLSFRGEPLREFPLRAGLRIGRSASCDVVVHDPEVAELAFTVGAELGDPTLIDASGRALVLTVGVPMRVGTHHALTRLPTQALPLPVGRTEPLGLEVPTSESLSLLIGSGRDARRVPIDRPITVGAGSRCDLVLGDAAVSSRHCRFERQLGGLVVRDLGSRNGTWIRGRPVRMAEVEAGTIVRVGRTDIQVVPRGARGDARNDGMVAVSASMLSVLGEVERYSRLSWPVLVHGESGVGKEGVARGLHARGPRADGPFVALNAGGMASGIVESELFGHCKGAFTGAISDRKGAFELADGGTLFLDEIGELPLALQARLLRVLETWSVRRVGGDRPRAVDIRLVCATHRDLREMIGAGEFREDLYYRIHRLSIAVPPLRERPDDVSALAVHFLRGVAHEVGDRTLSPEATEALMEHDWPGNARELRNVVCVAAALTAQHDIGAREIRRALLRVSGPGLKRVVDADLSSVVAQHNGNLSAAARALGIARSTLRDRLRRESEAA